MSTAYASYAQACGPALASAMEAGLPQYNEIANAPTNNISNGDFQSWLSTEDPDYMNAFTTCQNLLGRVEALEGLETTSTPATPAPSGTSAGGNAAPSNTPSTKPNSTPSAPLPTTSTGAAKVHGPRMLFLMAGIWVIQWGLMAR